ncbi:MAG: DUF5106 domain-containing protein [Bacteroidales bacterium]|nr:DUF5106 domain-containing protein [Bacteroidales bacterium]
MKNIRFLFLLLLISFTINCFADGYKIKVHIKGLKDVDLYLGYHFADKKFVVDTIKIDNKGNGIFEGNEPLKKGIYLIVMPNKTYFEILIDNDQEFSVETDTTDYINNMKFSGSSENNIFLNYNKYMIEQQKKAADIRKKLGNKDIDEDSTKYYKDELTKTNDNVKQKWNEIISENPNSLLAKIVNILIDVEIPDAPVNENGNITDSLFQYNYFKDHFFDHFDFSESGLLRTPLIQNKINYFIKKVIVQNPDSIIKETGKLIEKAKVNDEFFQYIVQLIFNHYNSSNIMGMDRIFVNIAEKYYLSGQATWADSTFLKKIEERVIKLKPNLIGKIAPDLRMITIDGNITTLHQSSKKFTILYFWEPDCGHCKKIIPKLHKLYQKYWEKGVEVFAVYTQVEKEKWEEFINDKGMTDWINVYDPYNLSNYRNLYDIYSTPVAFVLNSKNEIIAKRIDIETIELVLEEEFKKEK